MFFSAQVAKRQLLSRLTAGRSGGLWRISRETEATVCYYVTLFRPKVGFSYQFFSAAVSRIISINRWISKSANSGVSDFDVHGNFLKFETMYSIRDASFVNMVAKGW